MASKLFHTVVGFGIALGAASIGCAAPSGDESAASESAITEATPGADRFCEVAWPTTKGGILRPPMKCVDPQHECGDYPADLSACNYPDEETASCDFERPSVWQVCKQGKAGPAWSCPTGTVPESTCVVMPKEERP